MPGTVDFRTRPFDSSLVQRSGKRVGQAHYWKLYATENLLRVIIHSVLKSQVGPHWWDAAVNQPMRDKAERFRTDYLKRPWHGTPGGHGIYYVHISDLAEIMRANSNLFLPLVPDVDQWIVRIELIRLPRNIVGHMNWPSQSDGQRIGVTLSDVQALAGNLSARIVLECP